MNQQSSAMPSGAQPALKLPKDFQPMLVPAAPPWAPANLERGHREVMAELIHLGWFIQKLARQRWINSQHAGAGEVTSKLGGGEV